jgi:tryptophanyl-tRNA synthetase
MTTGSGSCSGLLGGQVIGAFKSKIMLNTEKIEKMKRKHEIYEDSNLGGYTKIYPTAKESVLKMYKFCRKCNYIKRFSIWLMTTTLSQLELRRRRLKKKWKLVSHRLKMKNGANKTRKNLN